MSRLQNYSPNENKKVHVERIGLATPATKQNSRRLPAPPTDRAALTEQELKQIKLIERIKMIMTRGKDDPQELYDLLGGKDYEPRVGSVQQN